MDIKKLRLRQADAKLNKIRPISLELRSVDSWIRYIRKALNMSTKALAQKLEQSNSSIYQAERMEEEGAITLKQLKKFANAMNCELVYGFVPKTSIKESLTAQATKKAAEIVKASNLHMELEDQALSNELLKIQIDELAEEIKFQKDLWDKK